MNNVKGENIYRLLLYVLGFCVIQGCTSDIDNTKAAIMNNELKYAQGFAMEHREGGVYVEVYNPWANNSLLASYWLTRDTNVTSDPKQGIIRTPVETSAVLSSTYLGMICMLDGRNTIVGSSNAKWISDSLLYARQEQGSIVDLGNDMSISAEAVISCQPDVAIKYIYQSADAVDPVIMNAGIPIAYILEFMEEHPLGRAEWIKFIGALLGKERLADSIFEGIENNYNEYKLLAEKAESRPKVLVGSVYKATWYAAGGNSYVARLLRDANAEYYWYTDSSEGNLPLSLEVVMQHQRDDDIWINANAETLAEIQSIEPRSSVFKAFKEGSVFHYNKRKNRNGGLEYYETGVVRPDLLLKDLLIILHPELLNEETVYYKRIE